MPTHTHHLLFPVPRAQLLAPSHPPPIPNSSSQFSLFCQSLLSQFIFSFIFSTTTPLHVPTHSPSHKMQKQRIHTWWLEHKEAVCPHPTTSESRVPDISKCKYGCVFLSLSALLHELVPTLRIKQVTYVGQGSLTCLFRKIGHKFKTQIKYQRAVSWATPYPKKGTKG